MSRVGREFPVRIKPTAVVSFSGNSPPLIKPDGRISRIRLSVAVHRTRFRGRPLRGATQCPLGRSNLCGRCYLPNGSYRTVLRLAVHLDQVRSLRSSLITTFTATTNRSDCSPGRVGLLRRGGVGPGVGREPTRGALATYSPQPCGHPVLADPAARMVGPVVIVASPSVHRVCQCPTLSAFTHPVGARLRGCLSLSGLTR